MTDLAQYRLLQSAFVQPSPEAPTSRREAGEVITFDGEPGVSFEPLNAAARLAKYHSFRDKWRRVSPSKHTETFALARSLGAASLPNLPAAQTFIQTWIDRHIPQGDR